MTNQIKTIKDHIKHLKTLMDRHHDTEGRNTAIVIQKVIDGMHETIHELQQGTLSEEDAMKEIKTLYFFAETILALRGDDKRNLLDDMLYGETKSNGRTH